MTSRREFLRLCALGAAYGVMPPYAEAQVGGRIEGSRRSGIAEEIALRRRFGWLRAAYRDLPRHFVFEYYPWYGVSPWRHWNQKQNTPPVNLDAPYMPRLGAYDSVSTAVIEQHARWIADCGVGAINLSWWGRGSYEDRAVPRIMDVMGAHGIHVTFHLEPYRSDRAHVYAEDVHYLLREYGERRRWDCFLLLEGADRRIGPVFKSFATIVPSQSTDCLGVTRPVRLHTPDAVWRQQLAALRRDLEPTFDGVTFLADSLDWYRTNESGFDGIAVYDNFVRPSRWEFIAQRMSSAGLVFSFNVNPGFYAEEPPVSQRGACYQPTPFEPPVPDLDLARADERERAARVSVDRINESLRSTVLLQTDLRLENRRAGFFLVYINSFNEWHEGTSFEPMRDAAGLTPDERRTGYANPTDGGYRLRLLGNLMAEILR
jgi:hypothetical protein